MDRPDSHSPQPGASPIKAFLIILALIILTTAIFLMTANGEESPDATRSPSTDSTPDFSLTDEEAIARFEELTEIANRAGRERDASLLGLAFVDGSPMARRASRSISELLRTGVFDRTRIDRVEMEMVEKSAAELLVREVRRLYPCFESESGRDVSRGPAAVEQEGIWTIRLVEGDWLIFDAALEEDQIIDRRRASCDGA